MNSYGTAVRVTTFGESHGAAIGGVLDGIPGGLRLDMADIALQMSRRRPGSTAAGTTRREDDEVTLLSGVLDGVTTGAPIAYIIYNKDMRPADYESLRDIYRPGHADYTYEMRYGPVRDHRGGGRSSARWTAAAVAAGAIAAQWLAGMGIYITAYTSAVGGITMPDEACIRPDDETIYGNDVRCPHHATALMIDDAIRRTRAAGDSLGGAVTCKVSGVPAGIGSPMFGKLSAALAAAMYSINAVKGFEIGDGCALAAARGSEVADLWVPASDDPRGIRTLTNHSGGIQGGISNGEELRFRVTFKPTPTIATPLTTVDRSHSPAMTSGHGRHDPCVVPRAVPVVRAMTALCLADAMMMASGYQNR